MQYLRGLVTRALAIQGWVEKAEGGRLLNETLDLSDLFHADTFLNALRQQTARYCFTISQVKSSCVCSIAFCGMIDTFKGDDVYMARYNLGKSCFGKVL